MAQPPCDPPSTEVARIPRFSYPEMAGNADGLKLEELDDDLRYDRRSSKGVAAVRSRVGVTGAQLRAWERECTSERRVGFCGSPLG